VLDDVERRAFLVQPAREYPAPLAVGTLNIELDERAGQLLIFPGSAGFTGAQSDHGIADSDSLAGLQREIAHDAVALVEEAKNRDPLRHRGDAGVGIDRFRHVHRDRIFVTAVRLRGAAIATRRQKQRGGEQEGGRGAPHAYSGTQA
jgi:hypothetical protein